MYICGGNEKFPERLCTSIYLLDCFRVILASHPSISRHFKEPFIFIHLAELYHETVMLKWDRVGWK